jgi:hypothetical protein
MNETKPAIVIIQEQTFAAYESWPPLEGGPPPLGDNWVRERATAVTLPVNPISARRIAIIAHTPTSPTGQEDIDLLVNIADRYKIGWVYGQHTSGSVYKPLSTYLPLLAQRVCSRLGISQPLVLLGLELGAGSVSNPAGGQAPR